MSNREIAKSYLRYVTNHYSEYEELTRLLTKLVESMDKRDYVKTYAN